MSDARIPWRILALVGGLGLMIVLVLLMMRTGAEPSEPPTPAVTQEVAAPPANAARDPHAAADYVQRETCRAQCASEDHICRATALEPEQETRCAATLRSCEEACR